MGGPGTQETKLAARTTRLTIEELASAAGMTTRNVRAHQSRGLLPPPRVVGRVGYYDENHLARLQLIRDMQDDGFNLAAIASALAAGTDTVTRLRELRAPVLEELEVGAEPVLSAEGTTALESVAGGDLRRLVEAGLLRALPDGRYATTTSALLVAARRLRALGVPFEKQALTLDDTLRVASAAAQEAATISRRLAPDSADAELRAGARTLIFEVFRQAFEHALDEALEVAGAPAMATSPDLDDQLDLDGRPEG